MEEHDDPDAAAELYDPVNEPVLDETESDQSSPGPVRYDITSYGADYDVHGLVGRLERDHVRVPSFQRAFVWSLKDASRFVESLLLGLPVPGIFLCKEPESNRLLVIDGQQRLKSLQFFYGGYFNPHPEEARQRVFSLKGVASQFEGKRYQDLDESDQVLLNDSIIHATIVRQDVPADDDTSINHIFERLNSRGRRLFPQEIRTAISQGPLIELLAELNGHAAWRAVYGRPSPRLKDQELILRFLALAFDSARYSRPMADFLDKFTKRNRYANAEALNRFRTAFVGAIDVLHEALGAQLFRPERNINAAVFDAVMVGMAGRVSVGGPPVLSSIKAAYNRLLAHNRFRETTSRSTADEKFVSDRLSVASDEFANT